MTDATIMALVERRIQEAYEKTKSDSAFKEKMKKLADEIFLEPSPYVRGGLQDLIDRKKP